MMLLPKRTACGPGVRSRRLIPVVCGLRFFNKLSFEPQARPLGTPGLTPIPSRRSRLLSGTASPVLDKVSEAPATGMPVKYYGVHHVAVIVSNLERAMEFYQGVLGLDINPARPHDKLPYRGAWLWIGPEMIHLMELENPDPMTRPQHGGRDRHFCIGVTTLKPLVEKLESAGVEYTMSKSGRKAVFFRDPDMNTLEVVELEDWREAAPPA